MSADLQQATPGTDVQPYCGAKKTRTAGTCTRPAGWGTPHPGIGRCKLHGGSTPSHTESAHRAAARQAAEQERKAAMLEAARLGVPVEVDQGAALIGLVYEAQGNVLAYRMMVNTLGPDELYREVGKDGRAEPHVWVRLYNEERDRLADVSRIALHAGVEERTVRLAEQQSAVLYDAIEVAMREAKLTPDQVQVFGRTLAAGLRPLTAISQEG